MCVCVCMCVSIKKISCCLFTNSSPDSHTHTHTQHLLSHDLTKRYGCLVKGAEDIKTHRWFKNMSWEALEARQVPSPFRPEVRGPKDTHNFEQYRESVEEVKEPVFVDGMDPFAEF